MKPPLVPCPRSGSSGICVLDFAMVSLLWGNYSYVRFECQFSRLLIFERVLWWFTNVMMCEYGIRMDIITKLLSYILLLFIDIKTEGCSRLKLDA